MKKKWLYAGMAVLLIVIVVAVSAWQKNGASTGSKTIEITIVDRTQEEEKQVFDQSYHSDAQTLTELLKECDDLNARIEESTYGSLLTSIYGLDQDMNNGPWFVFESENNASCKDNGGMCPAMDDVAIEDGDHFTFALIASFS